MSSTPIILRFHCLCTASKTLVCHHNSLLCFLHTESLEKTQSRASLKPSVVNGMTSNNNNGKRSKKKKKEVERCQRKNTRHCGSSCAFWGCLQIRHCYKALSFFASKTLPTFFRDVRKKGLLKHSRCFAINARPNMVAKPLLPSPGTNIHRNNYGIVSVQAYPSMHLAEGREKTMEEQTVLQRTEPYNDNHADAPSPLTWTLGV